MDCLNIGLIGYGVVGQGVVKALKSRRKFLREKYETDYVTAVSTKRPRRDWTIPY